MVPIQLICAIEPLACIFPPPANLPIPAGLPCAPSIIGLCLVFPPEQKGGIFGFAGFVQAFALLILVYTISDVRYRFRAATAPIPIWRTTFYVSALIGFGTLFTDLWFSKQYPTPWFLADQAYWQVAFGILFLALVMLWIWYVFVDPPKFSRLNPRNFIRQVHFYLLQGDEKDLPVIAGELRRSAWNIVKYAPGLPYRQPPGYPEPPPPKLTPANQCAHDILLLIGSRKFCRHIVASAPITAIAFFQAMSALEKYRLPIGQFASNISSEALLNKDSIIYHEDEGFYSGYFGYTRPFTNAVYGDYILVEALSEGSSPLDVQLEVQFGLDAQQLKAYCRAVLTTLKAALDAGHFYNHSFAIYRSFSVIKGASHDIYKLDDNPDAALSKDIHARVRAAVDFINEAIKLFDQHGIERTRLRQRDEEHRWQKDYYDYLAEMMFDVIHHVSMLKKPGYNHWFIQYSAVWSQFFGIDDSPVRRIVLFKLRRLLYQEVLHLDRFPNFKSGPILGYLLMVMGLSVGKKKDHRSQEYQLRKAVLSWTRRRYLWLVQKNHKVAASTLVGTITFDKQRKRLAKTYNNGLSLKPPREYLNLLPGPPKPRKPKQPRTATP